MVLKREDTAAPLIPERLTLAGLNAAASEKELVQDLRGVAAVLTG